MPVSSARISWVLRAIRIEAGVGKAMASSKELVCKRLCAAEHCRQRLDRRADDVVVRVLFGQADARGLAMHAQRQARRVLAAKIAASAAPTTPARRAVSRSP